MDEKPNTTTNCGLECRTKAPFIGPSQCSLPDPARVNHEINRCWADSPQTVGGCANLGHSMCAVRLCEYHHERMCQ